MLISSLSSGSRGNCYFVDTGREKLLIDNGLSLKNLIARASSLEIDLAKIDAILVTHEHSDHIGGVAMLSKTFGIEVFCHPMIKDSVQKHDQIKFASDNHQYELGFDIGHTSILPFRTPHDAIFSCGYKIAFEGKTIAIATDLGFVTNGIYENIVGSDLVVLESNHDVSMLTAGSYPPHLKRRILGNTGHLSNLACSHTIRRLFLDGTSKFILAHISQDNNTPKMAFDQTEQELKELRAEGYVLEVALQHQPTKLFEV